MARRASLQMISDEQISWPLELNEWAIKDSCLSNISVMYKESKNYEKADDFLNSRFEKCKKIPGTHRLHCVEPEKNYSLKVKTYSSCQNYKIVSFVEPNRQSRRK